MATSDSEKRTGPNSLPSRDEVRRGGAPGWSSQLCREDFEAPLDSPVGVGARRPDTANGGIVFPSRTETVQSALLAEVQRQTAALERLADALEQLLAIARKVK